MNIPSRNALLHRDTAIKVIRELCEKMHKFEQNCVTKEDLAGSQVAIVAAQPIPSVWPADFQHSMADLIEAINNDQTAIPGRQYLSSVRLSDLPYYNDNGTQKRLVQAEMRIEIMAQDYIPDGNSEGMVLRKVILFTVTSNLEPYHWEYTSVWGGTGNWIAFNTL